MNIDAIQKLIASRFFGEEFTRYSENINAILSCTNLDRYNAIKSTLSESDIDDLFKRCVSKDLLSSSLVDRERKNVFIRLKAVSTSADFV